MSDKRIRIFAGPNGSGKSTFVRNFPTTSKRTLGVYINADDIEKSFNDFRTLDLSCYHLQFDTQDIQDYFKASTFAPVLLGNAQLWQSFQVINNKLVVDDSLSINSYITADLAEFFRQKLVEKGTSFSFETVMSDALKLTFLQTAKEKGYRIYLYYFSTEDPEININRVKLRVAQNGHDVTPDKITYIYYKSLDNLKEAIHISDRAYLFDNTRVTKLIAEITKGHEVEVIDPYSIPNWFIKYVYEEEK